MIDIPDMDDFNHLMAEVRQVRAELVRLNKILIGAPEQVESFKASPRSGWGAARAEALLADAAEAVSLREQLDVALRQLGEWREAVVAANRLSQEFEARALRAEAALEEARAALSLPAEPLPDGFPYTVPGEEYARGYRDGHLASVEWLDNGPEFEFAAHALRQAILPGQPSPAEPASPEVPGVRRCQDCGTGRAPKEGK